MSNSKNQPLVSIIIPTRNAALTLSQCLKSILRQTYQNIEIVVVDNFSTDQTLNIARKFADSVYSKGPERSAQRNFGVKKSAGTFIAWFDADMILEPKVIENCVVKFIKNDQISAFIIPERSIGQGFWAACRALEKKCYLGDLSIESVRFMKRNIFNKVGKLSENFISGEDWDITTRVRQKGFLIDRISSFVKHNEGNLSLWVDLRKKYYYATKSLPYVKRHIKNPSDVAVFIFRPAFFRNWRILLSDPTHAVGLLFMKFCEYGVGLIGLLYAKLNYEKN